MTAYDILCDLFSVHNLMLIDKIKRIYDRDKLQMFPRYYGMDGSLYQTRYIYSPERNDLYKISLMTDKVISGQYVPNIKVTYGNVWSGNKYFVLELYSYIDKIKNCNSITITRDNPDVSTDVLFKVKYVHDFIINEFKHNHYYND